jgi:hypothetical protein
VNSQGAMKFVFMFKVLSVIYFFNFFISMFFYMGVMQFCVAKVGWLLQVVFPSEVCCIESLFINMTTMGGFYIWFGSLFERMFQGPQLGSRTFASNARKSLAATVFKHNSSP